MGISPHNRKLQDRKTLPGWRVPAQKIIRDEPQWSEAELTLKQDGSYGVKETEQVLPAGFCLAIRVSLWSVPSQICYCDLLSHHRATAPSPRVVSCWWSPSTPHSPPGIGADARGGFESLVPASRLSPPCEEDTWSGILPNDFPFPPKPAGPRLYVGITYRSSKSSSYP